MCCKKTRPSQNPVFGSGVLLGVTGWYWVVQKLTVTQKTDDPVSVLSDGEFFRGFSEHLVLEKLQLGAELCFLSNHYLLISDSKNAVIMEENPVSAVPLYNT